MFNSYLELINIRNINKYKVNRNWFFIIFLYFYCLCLVYVYLKKSDLFLFYFKFCMLKRFDNEFFRGGGVD